MFKRSRSSSPIYKEKAERLKAYPDIGARFEIGDMDFNHQVVKDGYYAFYRKTTPTGCRLSDVLSQNRYNPGMLLSAEKDSLHFLNVAHEVDLALSETYGESRVYADQRMVITGLARRAAERQPSHASWSTVLQEVLLTQIAMYEAADMGQLDGRIISSNEERIANVVDYFAQQPIDQIVQLTPTKA